MTYKTTIEKLKELVYKGDDIQSVCDMIILGAVLGDSSDIHVEPLSSFVRLRYRLDGELREILEYQSFLHAGVIARFKILADLKIDESRKPQDGRISRSVEGRDLDLRVSTLPTIHGEKVVMRIVDKSKKIPKLKDLGIEGRNLELVKKAISLPNGVILTCGPTGSGKSTTLYSALTLLNKIDVNIMTLEDPVENQVDGINQSQVKPDIGYSFAYGLRTALRQDPDIIMVGEMRDKETVDIAVEASLTGHLVLSTIHTNNASETITRVLNMGVQPFLIPASFNLVLAQRLVKKLCSCKQAYELSELGPVKLKDIKNAMSITDKKELTSRLGDILKAPKLYRPKGCDNCDNSGYKGRIGIYEALEITPGVKEMILAGQSAFNINRQAIEDGMISLEQDGIIKALAGHTSLEEVYRVAKSQND